jgi:MYXO-CTERM domain-containing protein
MNTSLSSLRPAEACSHRAATQARPLRCGLAALAASLALASTAHAETASYVFRGDISGVLGGVAVSGPLTLTVIGNTDDVTDNGNTAMLDTGLVATFELPGFSPFTVTNPTYVFVNRTAPAVGFGVMNIPICCDIIQHRIATYAGYDLLSSVGPLAAPANPSLVDWVDVPTSAGLFTVGTMTNNVFEAQVGSPVPEAPTWALWLAGAALIGRLRRQPAA